MADTYGMCKYGQDNEMNYYNYEKRQNEPYSCLRYACSVRGLCEFHDKEYSENNADSVTDLFYQWVNEQISASPTIYCIGFHFPRKVDFTSFQFKNSVDFSYAEFTGIATFSSAEFQSITEFINTDFRDEIEFRGTTFASSQQGYLTEPLVSWNDLLEYPDNFDENKIIYLRYAGLYLPSSSEKSENKKRDVQINIISSNKKESNVLLTLHKWRRKVALKIINTKEVHKFLITKEEDGKINLLAYIIPVRFDYSTYRKRVRFVGDSNSPLQLKSVSFKGVDLSQVEFHNVEWLKKKGPFDINRTTIVDEETIDEYGNYQDVSGIYNQLRKNYESRLLFNEASNSLWEKWRQ